MSNEKDLYLTDDQLTELRDDLGPSGRYAARVLDRWRSADVADVTEDMNRSDDWRMIGPWPSVSISYYESEPNRLVGFLGHDPTGHEMYRPQILAAAEAIIAVHNTAELRTAIDYWTLVLHRESIKTMGGADESDHEHILATIDEAATAIMMIEAILNQQLPAIKPEPAVDAGPLVIKEGNMIRRASDGRIARATQDFVDEDREYTEIVAQFPHENDDFSYACGRDYCCCMN